MHIMRIIWDFLLIMSITVWILGLAAQLNFPAHYVALFLIGLTFFIAMINIGGDIGRCIRTLFRTAIPICALVVFLVVFGRGYFKEICNLFFYLLQLLIMLFGYYIMFGGFFSSFRRKKKK